MKKYRNFDSSDRIMWPDNGTMKTMGVYMPKDGQTKKYDSDGNLLPWITKYTDGWRAQLEEGEENRFLAWYNAIEKDCKEFLDSCTSFVCYSNSNWSTATGHAHNLKKKSLEERSKLIDKIGYPSAGDENTDYWFDVTPSVDVLFYLRENCKLTIF